MFLAVGQGLVEPVQVLLVPGVPVQHQGCDQNLIVRPPQLHVVLVGLGGLLQAVGEVQQSAVLIVPAGFDGPVENFGGLLHQFLVAGALGVLQQEPHALDIVAGIDGTALGVVEAGGAVHVHVLQHALQFGMDVVFENLVHTGLGTLLIQGLPLAVHPQQHAGDVQDDHGDAEGPAGAGLGNGLGAHTHGVGHTVGQIPVQVIGPACALQIFLLAGDAVILGVGQGVEGLGEVVAALAEGLAVLGDGEVHPAAGLPVDAVFLHKVQAALTGRQPFLLHTIGVAEEREDPAAAALHPHALVGGVDLTLAVQAGIHAAVFPVNAVFQPEVGADVQFVLHPVPIGLQLYFVHGGHHPFRIDKSIICPFAQLVKKI